MHAYIQNVINMIVTFAQSTNVSFLYFIASTIKKTSIFCAQSYLTKIELNSISFLR